MRLPVEPEARESFALTRPRSGRRRHFFEHLGVWQRQDLFAGRLEPLSRRWYERMKRGFTAMPAPLQGAFLFLVALGLHEAASATAVPFVYFQF